MVKRSVTLVLLLLAVVAFGQTTEPSQPTRVDAAAAFNLVAVQNGADVLVIRTGTDPIAGMKHTFVNRGNGTYLFTTQDPLPQVRRPTSYRYWVKGSSATDLASLSVTMKAFTANGTESSSTTVLVPVYHMPIH